MPKTERIVINTGPILALIAGMGDLHVLKFLFQRVLVPFEVCEEVLAGGSTGFGVLEFSEADFLFKIDKPVAISPYLRNSLDSGESSVIQTALDQNIPTVCIDETVGRRIARLNGLRLTGSLGIMIRAKNEGYPLLLRNVIERMRSQGVWLSQKTVDFVLKRADE